MQGYELGQPALRQIQQLVRKEMLQATKTIRNEVLASQQTQAVYLAKTGAGGIDAATGDTATSATVTVQQIKADGSIEAATNSSGNVIEVTAWNVAESAVQANTVIQLKQELASGKLLVDFEKC